MKALLLQEPSHLDADESSSDGHDTTRYTVWSVVGNHHGTRAFRQIVWPTLQTCSHKQSGFHQIWSIQNTTVFCEIVG